MSPNCKQPNSNEAHSAEICGSDATSRASTIAPLPCRKIQPRPTMVSAIVVARSASSASAESTRPPRRCTGSWSFSPLCRCLAPGRGRGRWQQQNVPRSPPRRCRSGELRSQFYHQLRPLSAPLLTPLPCPRSHFHPTVALTLALGLAVTQLHAIARSSAGFSALAHDDAVARSVSML